MNRKLSFSLLSSSLAIVLIGTTAFASHDYNNTSTGNQDASNGANWNGGAPNGDGQDVNFTQTLSSGVAQTNTNLGGSPTSSQFNFLRLNTGGAGTMVTITAGGIDTTYGMEILNANDTLILNGGSSVLSHGNVAFNNQGTIILSNGATAFENLSGASMNNAGTLELAGANTDLNFGQTTQLNNLSSGTIVKSGGGTGHLTGTFGGSNISILNNGTIVVNGGTLIANSVDAFNDNGFHNNGGSRLIINSGATFAVDRTANAWDNDGKPNNDGTITLNGGTLTALRAGSQNASQFYQNNNFIIGSGTLAASIAQTGAGNTIASNGVLSMFGTYAGNQATVTSVGGQFGTFKAVNGGTLQFNGTVVSGMGGSWGADAGGVLDVNNQNVDLGAAFMPGSNIKGTVRVTTGGNFTLSSTVSSGGYQDNQGTFDFGGGTILMPNDSVNTVSGEFTNSATGTIKGFGTLQTGFGGGGAPDYAIINHGVITATNGTLSLNPNDAANNGGFQNRSDGVVDIANNGTLAIVRSQNAWNGNPAANNSGSILLNGGDLAAASIGGAASTSISNNTGGLIRGNGTIDSSWTRLNNSGTIFANSLSPLVISASTLNNNSGAVVTANTSRVVVNGAFNNASGGTFSMINGVGTFNGAVVNSGAWVTDPSTNVFNASYTVTSSGSISAAAGDVYIFRSNFVNQSTQNTSYNTFNTTAGGSGAAGTKFIFDGTNTLTSSGYTQQFFTAGLKLTGGFSGTPSPTSNGVQFVTSFAAVTGFQNNFALDRLEIGNAGTNSTVEFYDSFPSDGTNAALFVNDLWVFGSSKLIISNNTVLYFVNSNNFTLANVTLLGNGELHQLEVQPVSAIPEPSVLLLWGCGIATVYGARRRVKKQNARG